MHTISGRGAVGPTVGSNTFIWLIFAHQGAMGVDNVLFYGGDLN